MHTIRVAAPSDAAALAGLAERTFRDAFAADNRESDLAIHCAASYGPDIQLKELNDPALLTLVAEHDGTLAAFAQVRLHAPKDCIVASRPCELHRLYVLKDWHGSGLAHELMRQVVAAAVAAERSHLWLGVWERNARAAAFYRKFGFEVVGEHVFQVGQDAQRDLIMAVPLAGRIRAAEDAAG